MYCRVSTLDQNLNRQFDAAKAQNIAPENIFTEKLSGKDTKRPELHRLMSTVQQGDTVIVESISRFARNTRDLLDLVETLTVKGVEFVSLKENLDTNTPTGKFMLTIFAAVSELERGYLLLRVNEGIAAAKARGVRFGRPIKSLPDDFAELVRRIDCGELSAKGTLARSGLKEATFYRRLRDFRKALTND
jgi:DNA invertase Pin-like site-specific DNA recombinase